MLLKAERQRFMEKEWPEILATISRLDLDVKELLVQAESIESTKGSGGQ